MDEGADPRDEGVGPASHDAGDRFRVVAHELRGLLDGSLRWLGLAVRGLGAGDQDADPVGEHIETTRRQLETVRGALERMASVLDEAAGAAGTAPRLMLPSSIGATAGEAVAHAVEVIRPLAVERGISLGVRIDPSVGNLVVDGLYSVLLNALRNAIESIEQATGGQAGEGTIEVRLEAGDGEAVLSVIDDGVGPPVGDTAEVFKPGVSSKQQDGTVRGIGLALAASIARDLGGTVGLGAAGHENALRPGAMLQMRWPVGRSPGEGVA